MTWALYLSMTLTWAPAPSLELEGGPYVRAYVGQESCEVSPLTLTWTPEEGFGATSRMEFGRAYMR